MRPWNPRKGVTVTLKSGNVRSPRYTKKHDLDKISCPTIIKFRLHMKVKKSYIRNIMNYMYIVLNRQQLDNSRYLNNVCITFFSLSKNRIRLLAPVAQWHHEQQNRLHRLALQNRPHHHRLGQRIQGKGFIWATVRT